MLLCKIYKHSFIGIYWRPALCVSVLEAETAVQQYNRIWLVGFLYYRQDFLLQVCENVIALLRMSASHPCDTVHQAL